MRTSNLKSSVTAAAAVAALGCGALLAASGTASGASAAAAGCPKEYFCLYDGGDQSGRIVMKTKGNWTGDAWGTSVFNNGVHSPGRDHVQVTWYKYQGDTARKYTKCVHYGSPEGKTNLGSGSNVTKVVWRGEC
ncbi:hypothetical protein DB35_06080 [Streptomyces abyssalis]|uniref:Peptidase inhibitor n=1 Tax=Streptomyces abyssalis TaxID=933944 RepID=A0A1E7JT88_9ACTN|nr:peptidase inhibitor family I36 protein [Streptomyces abyssalis]OEU92100.1 hypothetical protein AN215_06670 [Streptomyces abyssalis]OEU94621.1 hypothetical protein DB35_06080 [Streptomyces abyssalis]